MNEMTDLPRKPLISEVDDVSTAIGDVLDETAPELPEVNDAVS